MTPAPDVEDIEDLMFVDADIEDAVEATESVAGVEATDDDGPQPPAGTG